jgi:SRSO17 transposase
MAEVLAEPEGVFLLDDTAFPKAGQHSVGARAPVRRGLGQEGQLPVRRVAALGGPERPLPPVNAALLARRVVSRPGPAGSGRGAPGERRELTKGQMALELLDQARAEGWPGRGVVADAGYGVSGPFRRALEARGLFYAVGVTDQMVVFAQEPRWEWPDAAPRGAHRPRSRSPWPS